MRLLHIEFFNDRSRLDSYQGPDRAVYLEMRRRKIDARMHANSAHSQRFFFRNSFSAKGYGGHPLIRTSKARVPGQQFPNAMLMPPEDSLWSNSCLLYTSPS